MTPTTELAEKLERECAGYSNGRTSIDVELILQAADTLRKQAEELERCRNALRPFAELIVTPKDKRGGNAGIYGLLFEDIERARSAYNEPKQNGEAK